MARVVVYSMAHRGDVFPFVPVASELSRRGHDVRFVVPREFHSIMGSEPFGTVHSGTDFGPSTLDAHGAYLARWGMRLGGAMLLRLYFGTFTIPHLDELFMAVDAEIASADLVVAHPAASLVAAMSCERRGVPWIVGDLFPMLVPTNRVPPAGMPNLGPGMNRRMWSLARSRAAGRAGGAPAFVDFRARLGLGSDDWNLLDARLSPFGNLALSSPLYSPAQPDWPTNYRLTGFTSWAGADDGAIPDEIMTFLDGGDPPVIVTLGSSAASARPELFEVIGNALRAVGRRGLHLTSNQAIADRTRNALADESQGVWPFSPLAPLLPRAEAIVHSGAHGTNALAMQAGLPSLIIPCLFDQLWHGRRQVELGTGILLRKPSRAEEAIKQLIRDSAIRARAAAFGRELRGEDGTTAAVDAIAAFLASG